MSDLHIPARWATDELLKENMVICDIQPADWQQPNKRCSICGQEGCDCEAKLVSIQRSFMTVACCWNCRHRVGGRGPRGSSDGGCDLTDCKVVPPDGWCEQHREKP